MDEHSKILDRIERLEKCNRVLTAGLVLAALVAVIGWQAPPGPLKVTKLEVIDDHGVPLVTVGPARENAGGSIVLRDKDGEKRAWWDVAPGQGAFSLNSSSPDGSDSVTLGLQVGPKNAHLSMVGAGSEMLSSALENGSPKIELYNQKGALIFGAPWKR